MKFLLLYIIAGLAVTAILIIVLERKSGDED